MTDPRPLTGEACLEFLRVSDVQVHPDGSCAAFVVGEACKPAPNQPAASRIWITPFDGVARPFTGGPVDHTPRWSPDGRRLAFLSERSGDGKARIYLIDHDGGEAQPLGELPGSPSAIEWSPDGRQLAFLMDDPESEAERRRRAEQGDAIEVEKTHQWRRIWVIDVDSGVPRQVTSGDVQVWEYAWAPDGGFVMIAGPEPYEWSWFLATLAHVGPEGGVPVTIYTAPEKQFAAPRVAPDGNQVAFLSAIWSDRGINAGDVLLLPIGGGAARSLTAGYDGSIWWINWTADGAALDFLAYEQGEAALGRISVADGKRTIRWRGPFHFDEDFGSRYLTPDGDLAVIRSDPAHPAELWLLHTIVAQSDPPAAPARRAAQQPLWSDAPEPPGDQQLLWSADALPPHSSVAPTHWRRLTRLQPAVEGFALGETRTIYWESVDGLRIQGLLTLPAAYEAGRRYPLVTWVHGGPAWLYTHDFYGAGRHVAQLFAGLGYAVLLANPRGSVGWGVRFGEANIGDFGGRDFDDIMAGVDRVIDLGIADADRLAIGGWSYGGFMSAWAISQTDRFKVALVGAGITNWRSFHGVASIGAWDRIGYRASPYEQGGSYDRFSPVNYAERITTPALIVHGQNDIIVPVGQAYELFRALKDHQTPVELVVYPREPHGLQERAHVLDRTRRYVEWLQRYLEPS